MTEKLLSIVIPVHNWDIRQLLQALSFEIEQKGCIDTVEIIVADDYSTEQCRSKNRQCISEMVSMQYLELESQIGRSQIRNYLIGRASGQYILFLDADVLPDSSDFILQYLECIQQGYAVVCGGIGYGLRVLHGRQYDFYRYKGAKTEWVDAAVRQEAPWRYLFTSNVLVEKSLVAEVPFSDQFSGYGYEDVEWGIRLNSRSEIIHIDNTCSHLGLVDKMESFKRMRSSIPNFIQLQQLHPQQFDQSPMSGYVNYLMRLPHGLLTFFDVVLRTCFSWPLGNRLSLYSFQLDKAVLFAKHAKSIGYIIGDQKQAAPAKKKQ